MISLKLSLYLNANNELFPLLTKSTRAPTMCCDAVYASHHDGRSHAHHCRRVPGKRLRKCRDSGVRRVTPTIVGKAPSRRQPPGGSQTQPLLFPAPLFSPLSSSLSSSTLENDRPWFDRAGVFVTNAVKHFKWEARGERRLHKKPRAHEIDACNYWLAREIERLNRL